MIVGQQIRISADETVIADDHGTHDGQMSPLPYKNSFSNGERWLLGFIFANPNQAMPLDFSAGADRDPLKRIFIPGHNQIARNGRVAVGRFPPVIETPLLLPAP